MHSVESLSTGFRGRYLSYEELTRQVHAWAEAFPEVVRVESIGRSAEERDLWLLTIGPEPDRIRPAAWVDGNIHAGEVTGSSVALGIAEDAIRIHVEGRATIELPAHLLELIRQDVLLYVLPRMCPDGTEEVMRSARFIRSNARDARAGHSEPYWRAQDIDGDGQSRLMRRVESTGDFVASDEFPNLMLPRRVEDPGPYYALYPEGVIEHFDGFTVPAPSMMSDMQTDMNRNFPSGWRGEPIQLGAGPFPTSEPESRAVTEFAVRHPNIFAWMALHTFGGVYIRQHGDLPDKKMDQSDLALYHQLEEWAEAFSGYPMVSGFEEFTYEPDKELCGDVAQFAYVERGAVSFVVELWDFFKQAGLEALRPFVFNYQRRTRQDCIRIAEWDRDHNEGRIVGSWTAFEHAQLGPVEIGGYDPRIGIWNPPPDRLEEVCTAQSQFLMRLASMAPRISVHVEVEEIDVELHRVRATVENRGYLPTYVLSSAKALPHSDPLHVGIELDYGLSLVSGETRSDIGHLEGWGGFRKWHTPILARSAGAPTRRRVEWMVRGKGAVRVVASNARVGAVATDVSVE